MVRTGKLTRVFGKPREQLLAAQLTPTGRTKKERKPKLSRVARKTISENSDSDYETFLDSCSGMYVTPHHTFS